MKPPIARPEDRQRSGDQDCAWAETQPLCFRSEAFAEDLPDTGAAGLPAAPEPEDESWPGRALLLPLLGLALAALSGVLGR